jgi:hypothetical protein
MFILPVHRGDRVILNPESENYTRYNESQAKNSAGTIISINQSYTQNWYKLSKKDRASVNVNVKWDSVHTNSYRLSDLLPVEANADRIFIYAAIPSGHKIYGWKEDAAIQEELDYYIIKNGIAFDEFFEIDDDYRARSFTRCAAYYDHEIKKGRQLQDSAEDTINELARIGYPLQSSDPSETVVQESIPTENTRVPTQQARRRTTGDDSPTLTTNFFT